MTYLHSRQEFERNFYVAAELSRSGNLSFSFQSRRSVDGLLKIREAPNRRINFTTVNELARVTVNSIQQMSIHETDTTRDAASNEEN